VTDQQPEPDDLEAQPEPKPSGIVTLSSIAPVLLSPRR
jgi:hypothetical protein